MPKAELTLPDGTKVTIDGTTEEVSVLLESYADRGANRRTGTKVRTRTRRRRVTGSSEERKPRKSGALDHIKELKKDGFFKTKRTIRDVRGELETKGHIYPVTTLSGPLLKLVRSRDLGRIKEEKVWKYVHR